MANNPAPLASARSLANPLRIERTHTKSGSLETPVRADGRAPSSITGTQIDKNLNNAAVPDPALFDIEQALKVR